MRRCRRLSTGRLLEVPAIATLMHTGWVRELLSRAREPRDVEMDGICGSHYLDSSTSTSHARVAGVFYLFMADSSAGSFWTTSTEAIKERGKYLEKFALLTRPVLQVARRLLDNPAGRRMILAQSLAKFRWLYLLLCAITFLRQLERNIQGMLIREQRNVIRNQEPTRHGHSFVNKLPTNLQVLKGDILDIPG